MKTKKETSNKIQIIKFCIGLVFGAAIYIAFKLFLN